MTQPSITLAILEALARKRALTPKQFSVCQRLRQGFAAWVWFSFDGVHYERHPVSLSKPERAVVIADNPYDVPPQYLCVTVQGSSPWLFFESGGAVCATSASLADNEFVLVNVATRGDRVVITPHTQREIYSDRTPPVQYMAS